MSDDVVAELDRAIAEPFGWHTAIIQRARDEIVALRGYRVECERQFQAKVAEIGGLLDEIVALREMRKAVLSTKRAEALEEAAQVCEGGYTTGSTASTLKAIAAAIRALKDKDH